MNKQLGTPPTVVTTDSVEFAKKVVAGYKADKFNMWTESGHDGLAINKVADSYGLPVSAPVGTKTQNQYYENWAGVNIKKDGVDNVIGVQPRQMTIGQLKETVYNSLKLFMFPTKESSQQEWAHATGITGSGPFRNSDTKVTYVGVDSAIYADGKLTQLGGVHFIGIADRYLRMNPKNTFNTTEIPQATSANVNDLKAAVETAKVANDAAQANLVKAQSALQSAQKALDLEKGRTNNLRSQLNQAGKNLETADKALATMIKAQSVYEDESKKLATARHHRDERVAYYNSLKGQVATANVLTQFSTPKATVTTASYKPSVVKYNVNPVGHMKDITSTYQAALPKTSGENGQLLAVVGMGLLGMAYLGYKKKIVDVSK
ncbi:SEC10/PgrA surface exclusion domain-containing protein [Streptococcus agalactiae]